MTAARRFVIYALAFNIVVLTPVVSVLLLGYAPAEYAFGAVTDARLILTSIYISIALVSAAIIVLHLKSIASAMPMSVALFAVQITYKLITVPMVGLSNPVVITNLVVVAVQVLALSILWQERQRSKVSP
jgi:hypothetical protein